MNSVAYAIGPVHKVRKKHRKDVADKLAKHLMKLLADDFDVIEIFGYKVDEPDDEAEE